MYEISIDELRQLFFEARTAAKYAREHYDDFVARNHVFTLYGPEAYDIGASVPCKLTPMRARKLSKKTRSKNYMVYELDSTYKVLRTIHMIEYTRVDCTYHHFELDDIYYAYPFKGRGNHPYSMDDIIVLKYDQGRPIYYARGNTGLLHAKFFEYPEPNKMLVSTYWYFHASNTTPNGLPVDWNAPIGSPSSPVQRYCEEEIPVEIVFSKWLK